MHTDPLLIGELRSWFKAGATPSALILRIAERYPDESRIDSLVRAYFREAFGVPMLRVGADQIAQLAEGVGLPLLNGSVLHRMVEMKHEWDKPDGSDDAQPCWFDSLQATGVGETLRSVEPEKLPELAGCWDQLDENTKQYIQRILANSRTLYEEVRVAGALAERLQCQINATDAIKAQNP